MDKGTKIVAEKFYQNREILVRSLNSKIDENLTKFWDRNLTCSLAICNFIFALINIAFFEDYSIEAELDTLMPFNTVHFSLLLQKPRYDHINRRL